MSLQSRSSMNVLFVTNMYPTPSQEYYGIFVKEQIDYLSEKYNLISSVYFINANVRGKIEYIRSIFDLRRILKQKAIDIIHIHYGISGLFLLFFRPKAKIFLTLHGGDILKNQGMFIQNMLSKLIMKRVDKVFVLNGEMEKIAKRLGVNYEIIPCGVNTDFFDTVTSDIHRCQSEKLIIFPGTPSRPEKNYPLFSKVCEIVRKESNWKVVSKCIEHMTRAQVRDTLNSADCLLMTSFSEGSPQIIKEALACGLPVVSVDVGDIRKVLSGVPSCYVSDEYDAGRLADLVIKTFDENSSQIRSVFLAKGEYDNGTICEKLFQNYQNLEKV